MEQAMKDKVVAKIGSVISAFDGASDVFGSERVPRGESLNAIGFLVALRSQILVGQGELADAVDAEMLGKLESVEREIAGGKGSPNLLAISKTLSSKAVAKNPEKENPVFAFSKAGKKPYQIFDPQSLTSDS